MGKRIATQLAEELASLVADSESLDFIAIDRDTAKRWLKWTKQLDARMRLDGSKQNRKRKTVK